MRTELENYESVRDDDRCSRLQAPQIWKSRFRMAPMIIGFFGLQVVIFLLLLWHFQK